MLSPTTPCLPSALLGSGHRGVTGGAAPPSVCSPTQPAPAGRQAAEAPSTWRRRPGLLCAFGPPAAKRALGHRTRGTELEKEATHLPEVSDIEEVEGVEQLAAPEPELIVADLEEGAYVLQTEKLGTRRKSRYRGPTGAAAAPATRRPVPARAPGQDARARTPRTAPAHPGRPWPRAPSPCSRLSTLDTHDPAWNEMCQPRVSEDGAHTHVRPHGPSPQTDPDCGPRDEADRGGLPRGSRGGRTLTTKARNPRQHPRLLLCLVPQPLGAQPALGLAVQWGGRCGAGTGSLACSPCRKAGDGLPGAAGETHLALGSARPPA